MSARNVPTPADRIIYRSEKFGQSFIAQRVVARIGKPLRKVAASYFLRRKLMLEWVKICVSNQRARLIALLDDRQTNPRTDVADTATDLFIATAAERRLQELR